MKYDFDEIIPRRGTNSCKWDSCENPDVLPMWVADMDFRTAPAILDALRQRVEHGIFGYTRVPDEYYDSVSAWFGRRHGLEIRKEWIICTQGVVPAITAIIKALTHPGDKVLIQPPVYNCFFSSVKNNGCEILSNPLIYGDNTYRMDFEGLERKASDSKTKLMLLCNPHNPAGRVWTKDELETVGKICLRHGVTVVSDEIHCELVYPGHVYTPFASISDIFRSHSVTCISPSKGFNIAGLQMSNIVVPDAEMRRAIEKVVDANEIGNINSFGVTAVMAAYNESGEWLDSLTEYIYGNYLFMKEYCRKNLPDFPLAELEGTYLAWMDCAAAGIPSEELCRMLSEQAGLRLNPGVMYGQEGDRFMRWNLACPRSVLEKGLERFKAFVLSVTKG